MALGRGVKENDWSTGFNIRHAVVDAIYAAKLAQEKGLPRFSIQPMLNITLAFAFVLRKYPQTAAATHAIARELTANAAPELDAFMSEHGVFAPEDRYLPRQWHCRVTASGATDRVAQRVREGFCGVEV